MWDVDLDLDLDPIILELYVTATQPLLADDGEPPLSETASPELKAYMGEWVTPRPSRIGLTRCSSTSATRCCAANPPHAS
jgi:hypothetical protein